MTSIEEHYTRTGLLDAILAGLAQNQVASDAISPEDIAAVDEFHVRGREVTLELASQAGLQKGWKVLDVGSGLGGPARLLAAQYDCDVTGIDITSDYVDTANELSRITGMAEKTRFVQGSALDMPFDPASFDVVWTQHVQMNIAAKQTLYANISRVLRQGGRFIYYDIFSNGQGTVEYPVPWASSEEISFLFTRDELHRILRTEGLEPLHTKDETRLALQFFEKVFSNPPGQPMPALGLHLLMGDDFKQNFRNLYQNIRDNKLSLESGIFIKSPD